MKKYIIAVIGIVATGSTMMSCKKITNLSPISSLSSDQYWQNIDQVNAFVTGIHLRLRAHNGNLMFLGELRSGIFGTEPGTNQAFTGEATQGLEVMWNQTLDQNFPGVANYGDFYDNINQINLLISRLPAVPGLSDTDKNTYLGMAYGLRAFYYFQLYKSWGDVVLMTEPYENFDINQLPKGAVSAAEVLAQVKADIEASNRAYGTNYAFKTDYSYWSKNATQMLKAEVYLWTAHRAGGSADATTAKAALEELKSNTTSLALVKGFADVFKIKNGNSEMIFASRYQLNEATMGFFSSNFIGQTGILNGKYYKADRTLFKASVDNWGGVLRAPTRIATFNAFVEQDTRRSGTIVDAYLKAEGTEEYVLAGCFLGKFQGEQNAGTRAYTNDYPIYRYADLLLMLAEAKAILGEDFSAEINQVRQRAYGQSYDVSTMAYPNMQGDGVSDKNEVILRERFFEFIGEGKRWSDLRRFGDKYVLEHTSLTDVNKLLWPLDLKTLTNNRGLKQTPGY